jgi:hypothetical protein
MNTRSTWTGIVLFGLAAACVALATAPFDVAIAQDSAPPEAPQDPAAQMEAWRTLSRPGEQHKYLEHFVGDWDVTMKVYMAGPGSGAMESKGTASVKWVLGGRYLLEEYQGSMMGMPYDGMGMTGYDKGKNLYVTTWASTVDTQLLVLSGSRNPVTGVFDYYGEMDEPMMNVFGRTIRNEVRILDENTHVVGIYDLHAGPDHKVVEIEYKRKK